MRLKKRIVRDSETHEKWHPINSLPALTRLHKGFKGYEMVEEHKKPATHNLPPAEEELRKLRFAELDIAYRKQMRMLRALIKSARQAGSKSLRHTPKF